MSITKFAQHGLVRLGFEMSGEGEPAILMLHGVLQGRPTMRPLADALENQATVITMDLRGHGGSSAVHGSNLSVADLVGDAFAVLDAAGVEGKALVVGVEMGAVIARSMKEEQPNRIYDVVLINIPSDEMLDADLLRNIADTAYRGQAEQALTRWLDLAWGKGWQESVSRARIAAARRSVEAIHPMLTALSGNEVISGDALRLPGGSPFESAEDCAQVVTVIEEKTRTS